MDKNIQLKKEKSKLLRVLDYVEMIGNLLPHPATLFIILSVSIVILSAIMGGMGTNVTYEAVDTTTEAIVQNTVTAQSLLSADGIRFIFTNVISNFTSFYPLGAVFTIILCVGVAEGTGFL